ncbi:Alcohol dehydrogenase GroES-like domain-containing protein [Fontimonas thermophila]|uniref:Alcohol dehydrogenase GroES-like domain-containing protein n=1 Tax=Fontimonas thermophila TaxID=1076937 RepID=A0A1I2JTQ5_9GAMM|nr:oxidoreductase [Fontimonas thermophila]SFF58212.1 Alcohol dehydrogenase GroES-like domain-containing protein [Fontimonas thermophila]
MSAFKALRVHAQDKTTQARIEQIGIDDLSAGEVVVRVAWSGINYKDALAVTGKGRILRSYPKVPGIDLSGVVESSHDPRYKPGDKVVVTGCNIGEVLDGGYAQFARLPATVLVPLPPGLSLREAMAIGTAGFTAAFALKRMLENHQTPQLGPIAITGPTGGVGSIAIDLFKRAGFTVHAITGKAGEADSYLRQLGADEIVSRQALALGTKPLESAVWGGAVDNLGGEMLAWLTRTTRPWGNIASIGLAQSAELHTTVMPFILRGVSLLGIHSVECPRAWREALWQKLSGEWKPRILDRLVTREIGLDEVPAACAELIAGRVIGRTLVRIAGGD